MKRGMTVVLCLLMLSSLPAAFAAPKTVAVMNFTNNTGSAGLQYLSKMLAESVSSNLSQSKDVRVVEREQLGRLLDEIALEQTGIFKESDVSRAGKLARADVLILGSYAGNANKLVVTFKAVDVAGGNVLDGKIVKGDLGAIFDLTSQASMTMGALIAGKNIGYLSVSSNPDNATVYIDGMEAGKTPVVDYKLAEGPHRVKVTKSGYVESEGTITIKANKYERYSTVLPEERLLNRTSMGVHASYIIPFMKDAVNSFYITGYAAQSFGFVLLSGEFGFSRFGYTPDLENADIQQDRYFNLLTLQLHFSYIPFPSWKYFQPYFGPFIGWGRSAEWNKNKAYDDGVERLTINNMLNFGGKGGCTILPYAKVSIFVEARWFCSLLPFKRYSYRFNPLGDSYRSEEKIFFSALTIGGGISYYFN